jgi:hypothetical protein
VVTAVLEYGLMSAVQEQISTHNEPVCRQVASDTFEVCCIPFFFYDLALGDIVRTSPRAGRTCVVPERVRPSGRFVFRVHLARSMLGIRDDVVGRLIEKGAMAEWSSASLLAVDAQDAAHAQLLADYLVGEENDGRIVYETGQTK